VKRRRSIVVAGRSGSGKTTAVSGVRGKEYENNVVVPVRFIMPGLRENDDSTENEILSRSKFYGGVRNGTINPHWSRPLMSGGYQMYGFEVVDPEDERLRVYSANNDFCRSPNVDVGRVLASSLVVLVVCKDTEVRTRLERRSSDIGEEERAFRLADRGLDVLVRGLDVELLDTTGKTVEDCQIAFRGIVNALS
jgi:ribose 1,5-bisphosphokinase PhnN